MLANSFYKPDKEFILLVGAEIRKQRKEKSLSIEALAEKSGIHPKYLQKCETGKKSLSVSMLRDILYKGLETSLSKFFQEID